MNRGTGRFESRSRCHAATHLIAAGTPIGPHGSLIAGQARARHLVLVTHNVREYERVPRLQFEDWLAEPDEG
ncbi:pilus biogenesis protein [Burkholderia sola]|nr:pilus biogenesis protein [Burkholderia cenocepacia]CAG2351436.1 pilus biogenesis protein [Burkholderia cenocepacia]CAG2351478.1 pilus biogenesis protein [Burkholderia cenocepacia]CAG2351496.1 pilus biogenesis protein [Burkholderia cenocepacia]CAG2351626.1 pilus biogenesis protein [Burkholderia cenocepacia]